MESHNLPGPLLNAFVTLAHCRRFALAAQRCHMSQPAFSQAIRRLELQVGTRLFERSTRYVGLTPEGELLLPVAEQVLESLKSALEDLRAHANQRKGQVTIAGLPSLSAELLPKAIMEYRGRHPGIAVRIYDVVLDRALSLVREGAVDFALAADVGLGEEFEVRPLFEDRFFLVCRPDHPLASRRSVKLASLAGEPYIHTLRNASMWRQLYPYLREVPLRDVGLEVNYLSTAAGLVAGGAGISVVTGVSLFNFRPLGLSAVPVSDARLRYQVATVRRRGKSLSVAARALEDMLARQTARRHRARSAAASAAG